MHQQLLNNITYRCNTDCYKHFKLFWISSPLIFHNYIFVISFSEINCCYRILRCKNARCNSFVMHHLNTHRGSVASRSEVREIGYGIADCKITSFSTRTIGPSGVQSIINRSGRCAGFVNRVRSSLD